MKIVKFKDGTYGIRKFNLLEWIVFGEKYVYKDLIIPKYWWNKKDRDFFDCKGTLQKCKEILRRLNDEGEVIE